MGRSHAEIQPQSRPIAFVQSVCEDLRYGVGMPQTAERFCSGQDCRGHQQAATGPAILVGGFYNLNFLPLWKPTYQQDSSSWLTAPLAHPVT